MRRAARSGMLSLSVESLRKDFTHIKVYYLRQGGTMEPPSRDGSPGVLPMKPTTIVGAFALTMLLWPPRRS